MQAVTEYDLNWLFPCTAHPVRGHTPTRNSQHSPRSIPATQTPPETLFEQYRPRAVAYVDVYCRKINPTSAHLKDDILSEAEIGLWQACLRYKHSDNNSFWTFAYLRVRGAVLDFLRREKLQVRGDRLDMQQQIHMLSLDMEYTTTEMLGSMEDPGGLDDIAAIERDSHINWCIAQAGLSEQEVEMVNMCNYGYTASEVALHSKTSVQAIKTAIRKLNRTVR